MFFSFCSGNIGGPVPSAGLNATDGGVACADKITDVEVVGHIDMSVSQPNPPNAGSGKIMSTSYW